MYCIDLLKARRTGRPPCVAWQCHELIISVKQSRVLALVVRSWEKNNGKYYPDGTTGPPRTSLKGIILWMINWNTLKKD